MNDQATIADKPAASAKADRDRFVAFAFCWADVLLELDAGRAVTFAGGATEAVIGRSIADLMGTALHDLVVEADHDLVDDMLTVAEKRGRVDGVTLRLTGAREPVPMTVAGYCFGDLGSHYYIALRRAVLAGETEGRDAESGLYDASTFGDMASHRLKQAAAEGKDAGMTLVSLGDYEGLSGRLDASSEAALNQSIGAALRASSIDGDTAAKVGDGRYALVHEATLDVAGLQRQITGITKSVDPTGQGAEAEAGNVDLDPGGLSEEDLASGLVYAINQFSNAQEGTFSIEEFSQNLGNMVQEAQQTVANFKQVVKDANFDVAFHPILSARTGAIHHYEALVRFRGDMGGESPFRYITFAEETGLIWEFDIEMVKKVIQWLKSHPDKTASVAVNISGHSIGNPVYLAKLQDLLKNNSWAKGRMLFEITESSRIENLDETDRVLQLLRKDGYEVCLDDFGAGAASFQYLSALEVDVVKLDGSAVKNAQKARKGRALMSALTRLCKDLDVKTVAEMVDDEKGLDFVRDCGVDYVQGFLFGKPNLDINDADKHALASARQFFLKR